MSTDVHSGKFLNTHTYSTQKYICEINWVKSKGEGRGDTNESRKIIEKCELSRPQSLWCDIFMEIRIRDKLREIFH